MTLFKPTKALAFPEFVAMMGVMIALTAVSTDAMLPALPEIGQELGAKHPNDAQLVLSLFFIGNAVGSLFYGPVSDAVGRKPAIYFGLVVFTIGCVLSILATTFPMILAARLVQGLGVAGPRSVATAVVRDLYSGRNMARVMSFIMAVFILIPIIAPALGQGIMLFTGWRVIFGFFIGLAVIVISWYGLRQPETLLPEQRIKFTITRLRSAFGEVLRNRVALGFTIAAGLFAGAFLGFLNSAQAIFQDQYGLGTRFPLYFAAISIASGLASLINARLVVRLGMRRLTSVANGALTLISIAYFAYAFALQGNPPFITLFAYLFVNFFVVGIMFGNLNSMAMEPLGHIAGVGSAVVTSLSSMLSIPIGALIGRAFNGTILPLIGGFAILCFLTIFVMRWADSATPRLDPVT